MQGSCHCVMEALAGWGGGAVEKWQGEGVVKKLIQKKRGLGQFI